VAERGRRAAHTQAVRIRAAPHMDHMEGRTAEEGQRSPAEKGHRMGHKRADCKQAARRRVLLAGYRRALARVRAVAARSNRTATAAHRQQA
jgi:hypothetical protein